MKIVKPNHTRYRGPFPCTGTPQLDSKPEREMSPEQIVWMKEHKPLYFTGDLWKDLIHLPQHLRHVS